jgi:hypothetical protein
VVDATWKATPIEKIPQPQIIVKRRPYQSAMSPAMRAPKNVPADRMETIRDLLEEEIA